MQSHGDTAELVGGFGVGAPLALGVVSRDTTPSSEFLEYHHLREEREKGKGMYERESNNTYEGSIQVINSNKTTTTISVTNSLLQRD